MSTSLRSRSPSPSCGGRTARTARGGTKGWYAVEPGKSREIVWKGIDGAAIQVGNMGYYATAKGLVWKGKPGALTGWIHPKNAFETTDPDEEIDGGKKVNFRMFNINFNSDRSGAVGTVVLRP